MLAVENVIAGYGGRPVLRNVTMHVAAGEFVGLIGPNGCGKTTLLRVVSGVLRPAEGRVRLGGDDLRTLSARKVARRLAYLLQDASLDLPFTVGEVALMGRSPHLRRIGGETAKDFEIARRAMEIADVGHLADEPVTAISGGERQRAFIAMCLAQQPEILLLDEPTNHLDIGHQVSVLRLIGQLNREAGMTVVAVFHDLNLAAECCDRLVALDAGEVVAHGRAGEVLNVELIGQLYGTTVHVEPNPVSRRPHVIISLETSHGQRRGCAAPPTTET